MLSACDWALIRASAPMLLLAATVQQQPGFQTGLRWLVVVPAERPGAFGQSTLFAKVSSYAQHLRSVLGQQFVVDIPRRAGLVTAFGSASDAVSTFPRRGIRATLSPQHDHVDARPARNRRCFYDSGSTCFFLFFFFPTGEFTF